MENHLVSDNLIDLIIDEFGEKALPSFIIPDTKIEFDLSDHVLEIKNYSPLFCEIYAYQNIIVLEMNN